MLRPIPLILTPIHLIDFILLYTSRYFVLLLLHPYTFLTSQSLVPPSYHHSPLTPLLSDYSWCSMGSGGGPDQHFCLRWNNFTSNIATSFEQLRDQEDFVDVTLSCEGNTVKAHKVVLSACSPYFRSLLKVSLPNTTTRQFW